MVVPFQKEVVLYKFTKTSVTMAEKTVKVYENKKIEHYYSFKSDITSATIRSMLIVQTNTKEQLNF